MGYILEADNHIIIKRHIFLFFFSVIKFISLTILAGIICYIASEVIQEPSLLRTELYILGILILNYGFIRLILGIIRYHNNLIIICPDQVIIIKASLLLRDKIESLDSSKIMKLDSSSNGFLSNIFGYGNLIIEQQNDEIRNFHFIHKPHKIVGYIQKQGKNNANPSNNKGSYNDTDFPLI